MLEKAECEKKITWFNEILREVNDFESSFAKEDRCYCEETRHALERLKVITHVKIRLKGWKSYCYPHNEYATQKEIDTYDISTKLAMTELKIPTVTYNFEFDKKEPKFVSNLSLKEAMQRVKEKVNRSRIFNELKSKVEQDIARIEHINSACKEHCVKITQALERLKDLIDVVNEVVFYECYATMRHWNCSTLTQQYDLSSEESMLTLRITTETGPNASLQDLLLEIDGIEKAKYLFNQLYQPVMHEVYHLQELANTKKQPHIEELTKARAALIVNALQRLYDAINIQYNHINQVKFGDFSTIPQLLNATINGEKSLRDTILFSEDTLEVPDSLLQLIPNTLEKLHKNTINFVRNPGECFIMYNEMQTSIVVAKTLCKLVECGQIEQIRDMNPSVKNIELIIETPIKLEPSSLIKSVEYIYSYPFSFYVGKYNALILAVVYRHTEIVKYFLEQGANPKIRGGRNNHLSAEKCVDLKLPFIQPAPPELRDLIKGSVLKSSFGSRNNFYKPQQTSPITIEQPVTTNGSDWTIG